MRHPKRLFSRPAKAFVAGFIGSPAMNLLRGALTVDGVRLGTFDVPLSPEQRAALSGPEVLVGPQLNAVHLFDAATGRRLPDAVVPALA